MPFDELTDDDVDEGELAYRQQLREAFASGAIQGVPQDDGTWNVVVPNPPPGPEPTADDITNQALNDRAGLNDRTVDYITKTNGVTAPLGGDNAIRVAKVLDDGLNTLSEGDPVKGQYLRGFALDSYKDGLNVSGDPQKAWDYMADALRDQLGAADPRYQAFMSAGIRGGESKNFDPTTGAYKSGGEYVDESAKGKLRGELQANRQGQSQYGHIADVVTSDKLLGAEIPGADKLRDAVKTTVQTGWDYTPYGYAVNQGVGFVAKMLGADAPDTGELLGEAVSSIVPQTVGAAGVSLLPGVGDVRGAFVALKTGSLGFAAEKGLAAEGLPKLPAAVEALLKHTDGKPVTALKETDTLNHLWKAAADEVLNPFTRAMRDGVANPSAGIDADQARHLNFNWQRVAGAKSDDLVTVYAAAPESAVRDIASDGFKRGGQVFTDADAARASAMFDSKLTDEAPQVMVFQVPRKALGNSDRAGFVLRQDATPVWNEVQHGWVENAKDVVRQFITQGETGSVRIPGGEEIPDDVAKLAFGRSDEAGVNLSADELRNRSADLEQNVATPDEYSRNRARIGSGYGSGVGEREPELISTRQSLSNKYEALNRFYHLAEDGTPNVRGFDLRQTWKDWMGRASKAQELFDRWFAGDRELTQADHELMSVVDNYYNVTDHENLIESRLMNGNVTDITIRETLYDAIKTVHELGEELYLRTDGKEGMPQVIQRAVKQFLTEEEGSVRVPDIFGGLAKGDLYHVPGNGVPAVKTAKYLGVDMQIVPHLRPGDIVLNALKRTFGWIEADPLASEMWLKRRDATNALKSRAVAAVSEMEAIQRQFFAADNEGFIEEFKTGIGVPLPKIGDVFTPPGWTSPGGKVIAATKKTINGNTEMRVVFADGSRYTWVPNNVSMRLTLQDLAAKADYYGKILKPEQRDALNRLRDIMVPLKEALEEQGIKFGERPDITPGGFYLPRGDAFEDGFDVKGGETYAQLQKLYGIVPKKKTLLTGAERTAIFDTMAQGVDNGVHYHPFVDTMNVYFSRMHDRLLNSHLANVMLNVKDANGELISDSYKIRLERDYPTIKGNIATLRKWIGSLDKSIDKLDQKTRTLFQDFLYNAPTMDLTELKDAVERLYTQRGTLRVVRSNYTAADKAADALEIWNQVEKQLFRTRGKYKGLTGEEAAKAMYTDMFEDLHILRGRFAGYNYDDAVKTLEDTKKMLKDVAPAWEAAKNDAMYQSLHSHAGRGGLEETAFGLNLKGVSFPDALKNAVNLNLKSLGRATGDGSDAVKVYRAVNSLFRSLRAGMDFSGFGIQLALGATHEPVAFAKANGHMLKALFTENAFPAFVSDFNQKALKGGLPTAEEWGAAGLHIGGHVTEVSAGIHATGKFDPRRLFEASDRAFGVGGDVLRLDGAQSIFKHEIGKASNAGKTREQVMREIALAHNLMTGWSPNRVGGGLGDFAFFAPRFYSSQLELVGHALTDGSITGKEARSILRNYIGIGIGVTALANALVAPEDFDWLSPTVNGRPNPNFLKIATGIPGIGDVSLFGPYTSVMSAFLQVGTGDLKSPFRSRLSPAMSLMWDEITGHDFTGKNIPTIHEAIEDSWGNVSAALRGKEWTNKGDYSAAFIFDRLVRNTLPFAYANPAADALFQGKSLTQAATEAGVGAAGIKATPTSPTEKVTYARRDVTDALIRDGTIPADMADYYRKTDYYELPSSMKKFLDQQTQQRYPDLYEELRQNKADRNDVYQQRAVAADKERGNYGKVYDQLDEMLKRGENPFYVWKGYDDAKSQLAGALNNVYNGEDAKDYLKAVQALPVTDMRRVENDYNAIIGNLSKALNKPVASFNDDDWATVEKMQQGYIKDLRGLNPETARVFEYSLQLKEQNQLEASHVLTQIKKIAQKELQPYYDLLDAVKAGNEDKNTPEQWLRDNPHADYMHFLTTKPSSPDSGVTLHSVDAADLAVKMFGGTKREVRLSGTKTLITRDNIEILRQYSNEITQLFETPASRVINGRTTQPRTELRKRSATYDALYFWLGMSSPREGEHTVPVYHLDAVKKLVQQWGPREDGALPKSVVF